MAKPKLLRVTTVPISLHILLNGQLAFMQDQGFELVAVSADGPEVIEIKKMGTLHKAIPFTRKITPIQDLVCLGKLVRFILEFKPDIIHTHTPKAGLLGMLGAWICRVPVRMHTIAGLPMTEARSLRKFILKGVERITYFCATSVYPNSKGLQNYILREFKIHPKSYRESKFKIIGNGSSNGINLSHYTNTIELGHAARKLREHYKVNQNDFVFCFVGRMVTDKGIIQLVESFVEIASKNNNVWLFLVGHFEDDLDPLPTATKSVILDHPRIIQPGFQREIRPWVLASDVFVLPSYREGFPNVVLQAGALEKPSIVSNINGCNEIIEHAKTGLLVPPKDERALQAAMIYAEKNRVHLNQMGLEARKFIACHFDQLHIWNELLNEYQKQLSLV